MGADMSLCNYCSVDGKTRKIIAELSYEWHKRGVESPAEVYSEIVVKGGSVRRGAVKGLCLFGVMVNSEKRVNGQLWTTSKFVGFTRDAEGHLYAQTSSGSQYLLKHPCDPRPCGQVAAEIARIAPDHLKEYLDESVGFWAPEEAWSCLAGTLQRYVPFDSGDKTAVKIYAVFWDRTEDEVREFFASRGC